MMRQLSRLLAVSIALCGMLFCGASAAQGAGAPTKVTVSLLYITADVGIFLGLERGYFAEQNLDLQLERMTSGGDAIALLANNKLDVGSGGVTPGLYNAFRRGLPIQIVAEKASLLPPGEEGSGRLLVRRDLMESGEVKTLADLKGRRIAINNLQSASLNFVMRGIQQGKLGKDDVTWVEMPFNQFIPALEKKAVDAVMAYTPFLQLISEKMKLGLPMPGSGLENTSKGDALNIMLYSPGFAKTDAAKRFMVAHLKAQRDFQRILEGKGGDITEVCRAINKYVPSMPANCAGMSFTGIDPNGSVNLASLERFQNEWIEWGLMKERADIKKNVNLEFTRHAVSVLGSYR